jgi:hypothetical protein
MLICLGEHHKTGAWPTTRIVVSYGHGLMRLFDRVVAIAKETESSKPGRFDVDLISNDSFFRETLKVLNEFAEASGRYFYLNLLLSSGNASREPASALQDLERFINDQTKDDDDPSDPGDLVAFVILGDLNGFYKLRNQLILERLEFPLSVLCGLFLFLCPEHLNAPLKDWAEHGWFGVPPPPRNR